MGNPTQTPSRRHILLQETKGTCIYCGKELDEFDRRGYNIDHIIPLSYGGAHELSNFVATCGHCNWMKGDKTVYEFLGREDPARWEQFKAHVEWLTQSGSLPIAKGELLCRETTTEYPKVEQKPIPKHIRRKLMKEVRSFCVYCGKPINDLSYATDHIIPLSKGGKDKYVNMVACCSSCLLEKGNKTPDELFAAAKPNKQAVFKRRIYEYVNQGWMPYKKGLLLAPTVALPRKKIFRLNIGRLKIHLGVELARKKGSD